jgi:membrane protein
VQWGFITFQFGVTKYNAIYGSFSILPLFLIWLQVSWTIVLLGAEIAFATQNYERYEFEKETRNISHYSYRFFSLSIMRFILQRFVSEESLPTADDISHDLKIPIRLVDKIIQHLLQAKLINSVLKEDDSKGYQPALESKNYTIANVIQKLEHSGVELASKFDFESGKSVRKRIEAFEKITSNSDENQNLLTI